MNMVHSPKAGITRSDIAQLVGAFYPRVRADARLGPIFDGHIGTSDAIWAEHMATIGDQKADVFNTLARRIGRSLWMGIDMQRNPLAPRR